MNDFEVLQNVDKAFGEMPSNTPIHDLLAMIARTTNRSFEEVTTLYESLPKE